VVAERLLKKNVAFLYIADETPSISSLSTTPWLVGVVSLLVISCIFSGTSFVGGYMCGRKRVLGKKYSVIDTFTPSNVSTVSSLCHTKNPTMV